MKNLSFTFTLLLLFTLFSTDAIAGDEANKLSLWHKQVSASTALIKSENQLSILETHPIWNELSSYAQSEFKSSLTFNDKGLTTFNFGVLEEELTVSKIYNLLSLFGQQAYASFMVNARVETDADVLILNRPMLNQREERPNNYNDTNISIMVLPGDRMHYRCSERATCSPSENDICTHNC